MKFWSIPELWPGATVFVIGGGPSLIQQDLSRIHDQRVIGVNHSFRLGSWVDVCWYGDPGWYEKNAKDLRSYGGLVVSCALNSGPAGRVKYVGRSKSYGLEYERRTHIGWNYNSGASAVNVAYWLGAKRVVLLGFDLRNPTDSANLTHWHNYYEKRFDSKKKLNDPYPRFLKGWPQIVKDAEQVGLEIINCTPDSALTIVPYKPFEEICRDL